MPRDSLFSFSPPLVRDLPRWFPSPGQEARAAARPTIEAPMRPWSPDEDRALRAIAGKHGMVKVLALLLGRAPTELYRRRDRLKLLDQRPRNS